MYHDHTIEKREFTIDDAVLLFGSRLNLFPRKLKSKWKGPYRVVTMFLYGVIKLENKEGPKFKVNGQRVKHYLGENKKLTLVCEFDLKES